MVTFSVISIAISGMATGVIIVRKYGDIAGLVYAAIILTVNLGFQVLIFIKNNS